MQQLIDKLDDDYSELQIRKRVYSLRNHGLIAGDIKQDLTLTAKGALALEDLSFRQLKQYKKWDKKWRVVIFDIPESKRPARDQIRRLVKDLGFLKLQISVWAHPLPCLEQFKLIRESYGIQEHLMLLEVNHSHELNKALKHFKRVYPNLESSHYSRS